MGLNQCTFLGRLTRDPEIRYVGENQMALARFTVAVDRRKSKEGESEADFIPCVAFDKKAEFAESYLHTGMRVVVSGSMKNNNYTNKAGEKVYGMELQAYQIDFADGKGDSEKTSGNQRTDYGQKPATSGTSSKPSEGGNAAAKRSAAGRGTGARTTGGRPAARAAHNGDSFMNIPDGVEDEGLPFN